MKKGQLKLNDRWGFLGFKSVLILIMTISLFSPINTLSASIDLIKYMKPAVITELDWLLLKAEVGTFSKDIKWDEFHLIQTISLYAIQSRALVGMTFVIENDQYIKLSDDTLRKVFKDAVLQVSSILVHTIPEVEGGANIYANFVAEDVVAEYKNGQVIFER